MNWRIIILVSNQKINMQDSLIVLPMFDDDSIEVSILTANTTPVKEGFNLEYQLQLSKQTDEAIYAKLKFSGAELSENIFALDTVRIPANTSFVNVKVQTIRTMKAQDYNVRVEIDKAYQGSNSNLDLKIHDLKKIHWFYNSTYRSYRGSSSTNYSST